jgi:hypothetical protein
MPRCTLSSKPARKLSAKRALVRAGRLSLSALLLSTACATEPPAASDEPEAPAAASSPLVAAKSPLRPSEERTFTEPVTGLRFPMPAGVTVDVRHFDASLPPQKFRHAIQLITETGPAVLLHVWDNPERLDAKAWFGAHLAFLVDSETRTSERPMSREKLAGILLMQPRSPQARSQATAVFASGERIIAVTCVDPDGDAIARDLFERILDELDPRGGR